MKKHITNTLTACTAAVILSLGAVLPTAAAPLTVTDWPSFISSHDFKWTTLPERWEEAAFIGNGDLGATIMLNDRRLSWEINCTSLYVQGSRIPVGHFALETAGTIESGDMSLNLWDAQASGTLQAGGKTVAWDSVVLREPDVMLIVVETPAGTSAPRLSWHPALARPARTSYIQLHPWPKNVKLAGYKPNELHPPAEIREHELGFTGTQTYIDSGASAVVARGVKLGENRTLFYVTLQVGETPEVAVETAEAVLASALAQPLETHLAAFRDWWHGYYTESYINIPEDPELETFYWRQIYKLGSAMRPDGPILDLMGPWFRGTRWPRIWWNMNIQLVYHPLTSSNRLELAESLYGNLDRQREQLIDNVLPARPQRDAAVIGRASDQSLKSPIRISRTDNSAADLEAGNLPWVTYMYWEYYRAQMDDEMLRERVYPLLALSMGHYLTHTQVDEDGVMHLLPTSSPEIAVVADCNYDLAFFRWGLETLIATCERLQIDDPRLPQWREALARLTPFPVNEKGVLMLGEGLSLGKAHRHFSHLMAIYPLHLLDLDDPEERGLAERSIDDWISLKGDDRMGFTCTGAASLLATLGRGNEALAQLNILMDKFAPKWMHPNTFYSEDGGPVIETPLSVVSAVNEMLLQSWGGKVRVFPAVPDTWTNVSYGSLRAEGAFLVSAVREDGRTRSVTVESLAGEPLRLKMVDWRGPLNAEGGRNFSVTEYAPGEYAIYLKAGERVRLTPARGSP